uniref:Plasmid recombination enzyme n=1 Tax=uncultured prokaryote TaxID=198431 RepID=A0A0H5Q1I0_9ZZZZ|nr:hypothetical protein [uncultured prokaryote]
MAHQAVIRIEKVKTTSEINSIAKHNLRDYKNGGPDNVDAERSKYNEIIVDFASATLAETVNEHIAKTVRGRVKSDSVKMYEGIMTAAASWFLDREGKIDLPRLRQWKEASMAYIAETFGKENIVSAVLHVDELAPHIHVCIVPVTPDGRLCAREWTGGREKMSKIQDEYAAAVAHLGLERGVKGSIAKHTTLKQYYKAVNAAVWSGLDSREIPGPPPDTPGIFSSKIEKQQYELYQEQCRNFIRKMQEEGPEIFIRSQAFYEEQRRRKQAEKRAAQEREQAAKYKKMYEDLKAQMDAKRLRVLSVASVAKLLGYTETSSDGHYRLGEHTVDISDKRFSFSGAYAAQGRNAIDFMIEHIKLTEHRNSSPAEAIIRLAVLVRDDEELRATALAGLSDRAENFFSDLSFEITKAREAHDAESSAVDFAQDEQQDDGFRQIAP